MPIENLPPLWSPLEIDEIQSLLEFSGAGIKGRLRKRLEVVLALNQGRTKASIIRELGISRPGIEGILKDFTQKGIQVLLSQARKKAKEGNNPAKRPHAGRPGTDSLREFWDIQGKTEPVIALVSLILSANVQIAVIAIRGMQTPDATNPSAEKVGHSRRHLFNKRLVKSVVDSFKEHEKPDWTDCNRDQELKHVFFTLRREILRASESEWNESFQPPTLNERFGSGWRYVVVKAGDPGACEAATAILTKGISRPEDSTCDSAEFLDRLESAFYHIRITQNIRGLFLCGQKAEGYISRKFDESPVFQWHVDKHSVLTALKSHLSRFWIFAAGGLCFDLAPKIPWCIPYYDRISMDILPIRPRLLVEQNPENPDEAKVFFKLIPQVVDFLCIPSTEIPSKLEKEFRARFKDHYKQLGKFEYIVRPTPEDRLSVKAPRHLLQPGAQASPYISPIAVISIPRQFLMPLSSMGLEDMAALAQKHRPDGGAVRVLGNLVFHCPRVLKEIEKAFRKNKYSDRICFVTRWNSLMRRTLGDSDWDSEEWFDDVLPLWPGQKPIFYFSDAALEGRDQTPSTLARLKFAARLPMVASTQPYNAIDCLQWTYSNYDADFLLREISDRGWKDMEPFIKIWKRTLLGLIIEKYGIAGDYDEGLSPSEKRILAAVPKHRREYAKERLEELKEWTMSAILPFLKSSERILRHAVENAQRFVLAGKSPEAVVVLSEEEVLQKWKYFLRKSLRGKLAQPSDEPDTESILADYYGVDTTRKHKSAHFETF
jgi:hypothetical protein